MKIIRRVIASVLLCAILIGSFSIGSYAEQSVKAPKGVTSLFKINRHDAVKGNDIVIRYVGESLPQLTYINGEGKEQIVQIKTDEDSGIKSTTIKADALGQWKLVSVKINNDIYDGSSFDLNFKIANSIKDIYGKNGPLLVDSFFKDGTKVTKQDFDKLLGQVLAFNNDGSYATANVKISGNGIETQGNVTNDGIKITVGYSNPVEFVPGEYTLTYSLNGKNVMVKKATIVGDVADSNFVRLAGESKLSAVDDVLRINGRNRSETAVRISATYYSSNNNVVLVSGLSFPDALTAVSFATQIKAPILYASGNVLDSYTDAEIKRLGAKNIYVIGGYELIGDSLVSGLRKQGKVVSRIYGSNRYATANNVANALKNINLKDTAILVNDVSFPDALSAGPFSGANAFPILYTSANNFSAPTKNAIAKGGYKKIIIIGGKESVSPSIESQIKSMGIAVERVSGYNRYDTSIAIANRFYSRTDNVVVASGTNFADALAGGPFAAAKRSPVLLSSSDRLANGAMSYIGSKSIDKIFLLGGTEALSSGLFSSLSSLKTPPAPKPAPAPAPKPTPTPAPTPEKPSGSTNTNTPGKLKVMLDPGHGQGSNHNRGFIGGNEGDNNYVYSLVVAQELRMYGITVGTTRKYSSSNPSLEARGNAGAGYDVFISLHSNAADNPEIKGAEVYDDVQRPNKGLANAVLKSVVGVMNGPSRGVKYSYHPDLPGQNYYGVLRTNKARYGMLVEHGFHTNPVEAQMLMDKGIQQRMAAAEAKAIANYFGIR